MEQEYLEDKERKVPDGLHHDKLSGKGQKNLGGGFMLKDLVNHLF